MEIKKILKEELIKEADSHKFTAGCLMLDLSRKISNWNSVLKIIDPDDIYDDASHEFGLELKPHVTVLFGFDKEVTAKEVYDLTVEAEKQNVQLWLTGISVFPASKNSPYDVVKFDISSDELVRLNSLCKTLPHTSTFPDYHPHMTIAYVKAGRGERYIKKIKPQKMESGLFSFSTADKQYSSWKIKKQYHVMIDLTKKS